MRLSAAAGPVTIGSPKVAVIFENGVNAGSASPIVGLLISPGRLIRSRVVLYGNPRVVMVMWRKAGCQPGRPEQ